MKVETILIDGFRTFDHFELKDLPNGLVFVIGKNGSGKSNLIAALRAVVSSVLGGWVVMSEDIRQPWDGSRAEISIVARLLRGEFEKIVRNALLNGLPPSQATDALEFGSQVLKVKLTVSFGRRPPTEPIAGNPALLFFTEEGSVLPTPQSRPESGLVTSLRSFTSRYIAENIHCLGPVRMPYHSVKAVSTTDMAYDASNLGNALFPIVSGHTQEYEALVEYLKTVFPSIERPILHIGPRSQDALEVSFREAGLGLPIRLDRASSGQVEALAILLRLGTSSPGSLVTLEEPEAHFHGDALRRLATVIKRRADEGIQILVTSHSGALVADNTLPVNMPVYFLERDSGGATKVTTLSREHDFPSIESALE
jgi:predicted ATPase